MWFMPWLLAHLSRRQRKLYNIWWSIYMQALSRQIKTLVTWNLLRFRKPLVLRVGECNVLWQNSYAAGFEPVLSECKSRGDGHFMKIPKKFFEIQAKQAQFEIALWDLIGIHLKELTMKKIIACLAGVVSRYLMKDCKKSWNVVDKISDGGIIYVDLNGKRIIIS